MARIVTLGALVTRCQQRADVVNDSSIPPEELKSLISELYAEMHGLVVEAGARHFESEQAITANGAASYALAADYMTTVGVDFVIDSAGRRRELDDIMVQERTDWLGEVGEAQVYALIGGNLALYPKPASGSYVHIYVPQPADLSAAADGTNVDVLTVHGEKFILWGVASIAKHKSESDQQRSVLERDRAREEVICWAAQRALHAPKRRVVRTFSGPIDAGDWRFGR